MLLLGALAAACQPTTDTQVDASVVPDMGVPDLEPPGDDQGPKPGDSAAADAAPGRDLLTDQGPDRAPDTSPPPPDLQPDRGLDQAPDKTPPPADLQPDRGLDQAPDKTPAPDAVPGPDTTQWPDTMAWVDTMPGTDGCVPITCAAAGKNCGSISDGCGKTLACGSCSGGQICGWGGKPNVCGSVPPDPGKVAPPLSRSVATTVFHSTRFLYTGSDPTS